MTTPKKTAGEQNFEIYADENGIDHQFHPPLNKRERPDYLTRTFAGEVLCEVEDFGPGDLDKAAAAAVAANRVRLPDGTDVGGVGFVTGRSPALRVKRKITAAVKQLVPYSTQYPTVAVLFNPGAIVDHERVITWAIDDLLKEHGGAPISAVGFLESFRPGAEPERKALRGHHRRDKFHGLTREEMLPRAFGFLQELRKLYPPDFFEEVHPRLRIFHLPSPSRRLSVTAFVGPFDEQVQLVPGRAGLKIVRLKKRWPRTVRGRL